jgi:hypothetical protein
MDHWLLKTIISKNVMLIYHTAVILRIYHIELQCNQFRSETYLFNRGFFLTLLIASEMASTAANTHSWRPVWEISG